MNGHNVTVRAATRCGSGGVRHNTDAWVAVCFDCPWTGRARARRSTADNDATQHQTSTDNPLLPTPAAAPAQAALF
jgi:hypothetical protein